MSITLGREHLARWMNKPRFARNKWSLIPYRATQTADSMYTIMFRCW